MPERTWTCRRQQDGAVCGTQNTARKRNCTRCGKPRQRRETSKTRHMAVLRDLTYEDCIQINGGEHCGICGVAPKTRKLDRDHEHKGNGALRGLLCIRCNLALPNRITIEWLQLAIAYLERFEERKGTSTDGD